MALKRYSNKEPLVFIWVMIPYIIFLNLLVFGSCVYHSLKLVAQSFLYTGLFMFAIYFFFGIVATFIQRRFPSAGEMFKRIAAMLPVFYLLNCIAVSVLFYLYNWLQPLACNPRPGMLGWSILYACIMSTIITFINEGVANWEAWKASITETEQLKNVYQRSRVLGLKGQINPHFLFNCFNTLSGLIQEDTEKAEQFLDEMTKVHRYLLRSDEELLVSLEMEMKFAASYLYLAKERFGVAIQYSIDINKQSVHKKLPPLSMQVILENIIYTNALSKSDPLSITISADGGDSLAIVNSIHEKIVLQNYDIDDGLDNLINKYQMLNAGNVTIQEQDNKRILLLPLFDDKAVLL
ncbi:MAG: Histidine kinase [Ferruginibacter sp.]|uniref:sensor histidine kinase n=1 Tax=Ferruginibacter sp. TaxID=1940288 RepID=UPI002657DBCA|nr:sensor histidine kinase [Ferruginibacter sp.]MDB5278716.1 Histidine kinase [Ferruginibacter sp.]